KLTLGDPVEVNICRPSGSSAFLLTEPCSPSPFFRLNLYLLQGVPPAKIELSCRAARCGAQQTWRTQWRYPESLHLTTTGESWSCICRLSRPTSNGPRSRCTGSLPKAEPLIAISSAGRLSFLPPKARPCSNATRSRPMSTRTAKGACLVSAG